MAKKELKKYLVWQPLVGEVRTVEAANPVVAFEMCLDSMNADSEEVMVWEYEKGTRFRKNVTWTNNNG